VTDDSLLDCDGDGIGQIPSSCWNTALGERIDYGEGHMKVGDERFLQRLWDLQNIFKGDWVPDILYALSSGPLRRGELLEKIRSTPTPYSWSDSDTHNLHDRVMGETLKRLEVAEMVVHTRDEQAFPPVSLYALSPAAEEFFSAIEPVVRWAEKHGELSERVRQRRRRGEGGS
jgi:DNA-binding HxlR family transcriptional regulator